MKILFVHQNFPGQFKFLAPALVARGDDVSAFTIRATAPRDWHGVKLLPYMPTRSTTPDVHPWVGDFETKIIRAEAAFRHAIALRDAGYTPDAIIAHPGWGESLFLKDVWPQAPLGIYCEFFYHRHGADVGFDPEYPVTDEGEACRLRLRNLNYLLHFEAATAAIAPTHWQASTFPEALRQKITVIHDGIETQHVAPNADVAVSLSTPKGPLQLSRRDEVITFVNRDLEPYRGYHIFMRALPEILRRRPNARVLIVGGDGVSYGTGPGVGKTWKQVMIDEIAPQMRDADWRRVHFVGKVSYDKFIPILQLSTVHVYLTYPFVLGWSLLEAMSAGCAIVASDTQPLHEAIRDGESGRLVPFFKPDLLAAQVVALLENPDERRRLGASAREFARRHYDLHGVCLPAQLAWVDQLIAR
jgi:glycosyltransferase involved in cell wall biosynthesis